LIFGAGAANKKVEQVTKRLEEKTNEAKHLEKSLEETKANVAQRDK
jgi:hypothetical protein